MRIRDGLHQPAAEVPLPTDRVPDRLRFELERWLGDALDGASIDAFLRLRVHIDEDVTELADVGLRPADWSATTPSAASAISRL